MIDLKLDIGCGISKRDGFIGVDIIPLDGVDVVHDLNHFPYPFESDTTSEVWMDNILEHLDKPLEVMNEIFRICINHAIITISVPYFRSFYAFVDPTHCNFFSVEYFNYFDPTHPFCRKYKYGKVHFVIKKIEFDREWKGHMSFFHRLLVRFAEKNPSRYEAKLSHFFPLNSLTFHLEVLK